MRRRGVEMMVVGGGGGLKVMTRSGVGGERNGEELEGREEGEVEEGEVRGLMAERSASRGEEDGVGGTHAYVHPVPSCGLGASPNMAGRCGC